ncbi:DUF4406 domain-containing protein [Alicyclobacillus sp. SP_1]|uniref:DUF4406 domain-containing protein n=1 Tax=Alicyclobacillus sp. SP_1 TaxID=2942475 RepID=UPI002156FE49|nr:DUF4406 domain-containing protein [Alicyclobacillus sp. SP_1]
MHGLKIWPEFFAPVLSGHKTVELRQHDRDYQAGDILDLNEVDKDTGLKTGRSVQRYVTHVHTGLGVAEGYVALSMSERKPRQTVPPTKLRLYLSGPMTGYPDDNYPAFAEAARSLRDQGYDVVSPAEDVPNREASWEHLMRHALRKMLNGTQGVVVLPGWKSSRGANVEVAVAKWLGLPILEWDSLRPVSVEARVKVREVEMERPLFGP